MDSERKICITEPVKEDIEYIKKQNVLVYDKAQPYCLKNGESKNNYRITPMSPTNLKRIRVCTGADMKKMCAPKLCECGPTTKRRGFAAALGRFLGFGLKGAVAGGLVYWTYEIGLWGRADDTERLYTDICTHATALKWGSMDKSNDGHQGALECKKKKSCDPFEAQNQSRKDNVGTQDNVSKIPVCQQAPSISKNVNCLKTCWNRGVLKLFSWWSAIEETERKEGVKGNVENEDGNTQAA